MNGHGETNAKVSGGLRHELAYDRTRHIGYRLSSSGDFGMACVCVPSCDLDLMFRQFFHVHVGVVDFAVSLGED